MKLTKKIGIYSSWVSLLLAQSMTVNANMPQQESEDDCSEPAGLCGTVGIAAGWYNDVNNITYPMLYVSQSGGTSWASNAVRGINDTHNPPPAYTSNNVGSFCTASCQSTSPSSTICIAGGGYLNSGNDDSWPTLAYSTNKGVSWTYIVGQNGSGGNLNTPPSFSNSGGNGSPSACYVSEPPSNRFSSSYCNGSSTTDLLCLAGGFYINSGADQYPMLAALTHSGSAYTLTYLIDSATSGTPVGNANFSGVSCNDVNSVCVAVGGYGGNSFYPSTPIIAMSNNAPSTPTHWAYVSSGLPGSGFLTSASCSSNACAAVGGTNNATPLLMINSNATGSTTWSRVATGALPASPALFNSVSCSTASSVTRCVAAGSYTNGAAEHPALYVYDVATSSGTFVTVPFSGAAGTGNNELLSVACTSDGSTCFAAGEYTVQTPGPTYTTTPVIIKGVSPFNTAGDWSVVTISFSDVPLTSGSNVNQFTSVSCNTNGATLCYAAGTYFDVNGDQYPLLYSGTETDTTWALGVYSGNLPINPTTSSPAIVGEFYGTGSTPTLRKSKITPVQQVEKMVQETSNILTYALSFFS